MPIYVSDTPSKVYVGESMPKNVFKGETEIWRRDPPVNTYTSTTTVSVPSWAAVVNYCIIGGGGSGSGGHGGNTLKGDGGRAGAKTSGRFVVKPGDSLVLTVGAGGAAVGKETNGKAGSASSIKLNGSSVASAAGGAGGSGYNGGDGQAAGDVTGPGGLLLQGGGSAGNNTDGKPPGGGGGPGTGGVFGSANGGRKGGNGAVQISFSSFNN